MNASPDAASWRTTLWLVVAFVIFGLGVGLVWWPASQQVDQVRAHSRELYDEANRLDAAVERATQLQAAQGRIRSDLRTLGATRSTGALTAALLRLFHDEAKQSGVEIREISPEASAAEQTKADGRLASYAVTVGLRAPFRNIVRLLADLPRHDVLIEVHDVRLSSSASASGAPALDATLHATIYRVGSVPGTEVSHVRAL